MMQVDEGQPSVHDHPLAGLVERGGFEPPKASPTDLQSVPFGRSGTSPLSDLFSSCLTEPLKYLEFKDLLHHKEDKF